MQTFEKQSNSQNPLQVAIVITNWNEREYVEICLRSLYAQEFQEFEIFVVDNASTDDSVEVIRRDFPKVNVIQNEDNLGLCTANNRGILATEAEFVAILNNDTELEPDWLGQLVDAMQFDPQVGMCACKMLLTDQRDMLESAGIVVDRAGIAWGLETGQPDRRERDVVPVFGACGGAALYRRSMLVEIGLYDDDFFVYFEDADIAWRGRWSGWTCLYVPGSRAYHAHSATIKEGSPFKTRLLGRNKVWLILKNYPWPYLIWYGPLILLYELLSIGFNIFSGRGLNALKGRWEAFQQIFDVLAKRRSVVRRVSAQEMMAMMQPVENPFALLRNHLSMFQAAKSGHYVADRRPNPDKPESSGNTEIH